MSGPVLYLFDIDGTLIGSPRGVGRRALEQACNDACGLVGAMQGIVLHGNTDPSILEEAFLARLGRPPTEAEAESVMSAYLKRLEVELAPEGSVRMMPQVEETLAALTARGHTMGLATGNIQAGARLKLERVGLWRHFPFGGFGSDAPARAELVRVAIARARQRSGVAFTADAIWVIGDTPRDIAAAHAAGVRAIGVATGPHDVDALQAAGADRVFPTLEPFLAALDN
jgi:phosphoglycolate phosphatase